MIEIHINNISPEALAAIAILYDSHKITIVRSPDDVHTGYNCDNPIIMDGIKTTASVLWQWQRDCILEDRLPLKWFYNATLKKDELFFGTKSFWREIWDKINIAPRIREFYRNKLFHITMHGTKVPVYFNPEFMLEEEKKVYPQNRIAIHAIPGGRWVARHHGLTINCETLLKALHAMDGELKCL